MQTKRIAVLIPCLNEERTVAKVVHDFRRELPYADVYVFDNASTDATSQRAREAGAIVCLEERRGKGFVVQSMFQRVDADLYVMVDGDDTYPAAEVHRLLEPVVQGRCDMAVGSRLLAAESSFRRLNLLGNHFFLTVINSIFGTRLTDVLSGYRVMSRPFVLGLPLFVTGFEVEVELTIKALVRGFRIHEIPTALRDRPQGSHSKLRKFRDGTCILWTILALLRDYKPLSVFGAVGAVLLLAGLLTGSVVVAEYAGTGLIQRLPSAVLAVGLVLAGMLSTTAGLLLHTLNRRFQELDHLLRVQKHDREVGDVRGRAA
jgi:glycosyltransferase involved in cell wall biosynthesis